jgi:hypothetical protein
VRKSLSRLLRSAGYQVASFCSPAPLAPGRVLVVHSFGSAAPPFTTHSIAFETALTKEIGERVDLDEVSLDVARLCEPGYGRSLVDVMRKRWPVGSRSLWSQCDRPRALLWRHIAHSVSIISRLSIICVRSGSPVCSCGTLLADGCAGSELRYDT